MNKNNIISINQTGFPISFENIIPEDDSVRLLYDVAEGLDYTELYKTYSTIGRNPAILPKSMFRIIIYGYMEDIYSCRDFEKACKRNINLMKYNLKIYSLTEQKSKRMQIDTALYG